MSPGRYHFACCLPAACYVSFLLDVQEADESEEEKGKLTGHRRAISEYMYLSVPSIFFAAHCKAK